MGTTMILIMFVYLAIMLTGQAMAVGIGLLIDPYSKTAALATFIPLYYAMFWVAWRITLFLVDREPAVAASESSNSPIKKAMWLIAPVGLTLELCD
jgi:hypothetical protein